MSRAAPLSVSSARIHRTNAAVIRADYAFAGACNASGEPAVALSVSIQFLVAVPPGTRLIADARVTRQGRRAGFYQMTVSADDGTLVATCQAVAHRPVR